MPLLENMRVFVQVVEHENMSEAGRLLRLSPAVVSHRIRSLEAHFGARLLNRNTRNVQPTEQGVAYYEACLEVISALERAESIAAGSGAAPRGQIRVTAPLHLGRSILAGIVPEFHAAYPQINVQLRLSEYLVDLFREKIDVAIRMAILSDSSLISRRIAECERILCAAPAYLAAHGVPARPDDLSGHNCLLLRFPGSRQYRWTLRENGNPRTVSVAGAYDADDSDVLTAWALEGRGIVLKPVWEVADHLKDGRLVPVLTGCPPESVTLSLLYPHRRLQPARAKAFVDHVAPLLAERVAARAQGLRLAEL